MKRYSSPLFELPVPADVVVRIALGAYYRAAAEATPPIGCPEPDSWSDGETFVGTFEDLFQLRLRRECVRRGLFFDSDLSRLDLWESRVPSRDRLYSEVDPEHWAQRQAEVSAMAHGSAALSPAVGPAQEAGQGRAAAHSADPLFLGHERQELPEVSASATQNTAIGAA